MDYAKMSLKKYGSLKGMAALRRFAEKRWGCVSEPVWRIVLRKAIEKNLSPAQLKKLIKPTKHPAEVFVRK